MLRFRFILLSLIAVFSVSAVVSSSAAALTGRYYEQPTKELGTEKVEGSVGVAQLQGTLLGQKTLIESTKNTFEEGQIEPEGKSSGKIKYDNPVLYTIKEGKKESTAANCKVEPIEFRFKDKLITQSKAGVVADEFEPREGKVFVEIKIVNVTGKECLLKGNKVVEGTYTASLGDQAEEDQTEHELVFTEAGSNVTFEKAAASYTNTVSKLKRTNGKEWYVD